MDPVGEVLNFTAEPGFGLRCTVKGIDSFAKKGLSGGTSSALISRYIYYTCCGYIGILRAYVVHSYSGILYMLWVHWTT